ncbi:hypothetical protein D3C72_1385640 [compost metagenome]
MQHLLEVLLQHVQQLLFRAALEGLGKEMAAFRQHLNGEISSDFAQMHGADMVGLLVPGGGRRHIRQYQIRRAANGLHQLFGCCRIKEVELQDFYAGNGIDFEKIDRRDADIVLGGIRHLRSDLRPASGCGTKVDDAGRALQYLMLVVDFQQLEGGAGAIAFKLGALHIGVIDMTFKPTAR